jgi:MYXO-CTERM domain-containing protein
VKAAVLAVAFIVASAHTARADGWWEACNAEQGNGCSDGMGNYSCQCDVRSSDSTHPALRVGSGLALLGFVGYRIGRRRRRK